MNFSKVWVFSLCIKPNNLGEKEENDAGLFYELKWNIYFCEVKLIN